jgi:hypothetical protein
MDAPVIVREALRIVVATIIAFIVVGCATRIPDLPSTIPTRSYNLAYSGGRAPLPWTDTAVGDASSPSVTSAQEEFRVIGFSDIFNLGDHVRFGLYGDFPTVQASTSISVLPTPYTVLSGWVGANVFSGFAGGIEAMAGDSSVSAGVGFARIRNLVHRDEGCEFIGCSPDLYWAAQSVPYVRLAAAWHLFVADGKVGYSKGNRGPWTWQWSVGIRFGELLYHPPSDSAAP